MPRPHLKPIKPKSKPKKKLQLRTHGKFPRLHVGDRFRLHPDCGDDSIFEVIRVTQGSATCRALAKTHTVVIDKEGTEVADFWKSGRPFHISAHASVILLPAAASPTPTE